MTKIRQLSAWLAGSVEFTRGIVIYLVLAIIRDWFWENAVISNTVFVAQMITIVLLFYETLSKGGWTQFRKSRTRYFPYIMVGAVLLGAGSAYLTIELLS